MLLLSLAFLFGALAPAMVAFASPQAAVLAPQEPCHFEMEMVRLRAAAAVAAIDEAGRPGYTPDAPTCCPPCISIFCLTPIVALAAQDFPSIVIPPRRGAPPLVFATGVSAASGPRKATNFATGPPPAV